MERAGAGPPVALGHRRRRPRLLREPEARDFESFDGRRIPYLLYGEPGQPTLCFVHGGPESQYRRLAQPGRRSTSPPAASPSPRRTSAARPATARTTTTSTTSSCGLDSVRDLAMLARVGSAPAPACAVGVMGGSYGGYMTLAAITEHPELWAAGGDIVGIANFVTFLERTVHTRRALREAEYGSLEHDRELLERISPIHKVDRIACPLMVVHGANDPRVPVSEAEQIVAALQRARPRGRLSALRRRRPRPDQLANRLDCYPQIAAFLERHLGLG